MAKSFPQIVSTRIDGESPVTAALMADFHARQEALVSQPIDTRFPEGSNNTNAFVQVASQLLYLPAGVGTLDGNVTLELVLHARVSAGTGRVRARIGTGTYVESGDITSTTYVRVPLTIPAANVRTYANSEVTLVVETRYTVAGTVYAKCDTCASRLERAT